MCQCQSKFDRGGILEWGQPQQRQVDPAEGNSGVPRGQPLGCRRLDQVDDQNQLGFGYRLDGNDPNPADLDPAELQSEIDAAIAEVRADRRARGN